MLEKIKLMWLELKAFIYFKRTVKAASKTKEWNDLQLRYSGNKIAGIINLREEDMAEEEVVRNFKATIEARKFHEYLADSLDFKEIVYPHMRHIEDTRSYLILYTFEFEHITLLSISMIAAPLILGIGALSYFLWI
jgi:hypothetical protein